jgi:hypothetical protein
MKIPKWLSSYGDMSFRGKCPLESAEQITLFNQIRGEFPHAIHPRNEGKKTYSQVSRHKAEGQTKGASDVIIPGLPCFVGELKRQDHTKSTWQDGQIEYLENAKDSGAFVCVAFGYKAMLEAIEEWKELSNQIKLTLSLKAS